jgi:CubicO group peptidase (beta-lactamase class C family)
MNASNYARRLFLIAVIAIARITLQAQVTLNKPFPLSAPEGQGVSSKTLDSMMRFIQQTHQNIHQLTVIRDGYLILSADFYPYSSKNVHDLASVTKSITSLLTGIAIDKGFIKDENESVLRFFPEIKTANQELKALKVQDLLTMRSGFDCNEDSLANMRAGRDWVNYIFSMHIGSPPGTTFNYCSCNFYLLAEIIKRSTGLSPLEFANKYLFHPLQITDARWLTNYKGINHGWGDLFLRPLDMAKIGQLVLNMGVWGKDQIVSKNWIEKSLQTQVKTTNDNKGYGYGWWTNDALGYAEAAGRGRQAISVVPSKHIVVTMLGSEFDAGAIGGYLFKSLESDKPLPADTAAYESLKKAVKEAALPPPWAIKEIQPQLLHQIDNREIVLSKNILSIDAVRLRFGTGGSGIVTFTRDAKQESYPFVCSENALEISEDKTLELPVAMQVYAQDANTIVLHYNQLNRINNIYLEFKLSGDKVDLTLEETSNFIKLDIPAVFGK